MHKIYVPTDWIILFGYVTVLKLVAQCYRLFVD